MDVKGKLLELLDDMQRSGTGYFGSTIENKKIADYLISNGVTVQEWVSTKDRLPDRDGWYITQTNATGRSNGTLPQEFEIRNGVGRWRYMDKISPWNTTHWQLMPQPPKGE